MPRPRIGITTSYSDGEQRLDHRYVRAVERAGGVPVIVPMLDDEVSTIQFAKMLDGLVVTGGPAVTDGLIGDLPTDISETDPIRTASDKRVLQSFLDNRRPTLGICYGMQLANALHGGRIYADVQTQLDGAGVHSQKRGGTSHPVQIASGSALRFILASPRIDVNTRHIQAVASVGDGFRVAATAPDGVIEAIERGDGSFLGVQFHPERMGEVGDLLFTHLIEQAAAM